MANDIAEALAAETPHMKYWSGVKNHAVKKIGEILSGGDAPVLISAALAKGEIEGPSDLVALMDYCRSRGISARDADRIRLAATCWLQAYNEIECKRHS